jgi:hypothetical protein
LIFKRKPIVLCQGFQVHEKCLTNVLFAEVSVLGLFLSFRTIGMDGITVNNLALWLNGLDTRQSRKCPGFDPTVGTFFFSVLIPFQERKLRYSRRNNYKEIKGRGRERQERERENNKRTK